MSTNGKHSKLVRWFIIGTFVTLYTIVSVISTIHVINFFELSNPEWLAISLAIAFEIGAAASLAALITLDKLNEGLVWFLFIILTSVQMMGNTYYAYTNLENFQGWIELFGLMDYDVIAQKRILSIISGAILPLVALGFIKSLVDYIKPDRGNPEPVPVIDDKPKEIEELKESIEKVEESIETEIESNVPKEVNVNTEVIEDTDVKPVERVDVNYITDDLPTLHKQVELPVLTRNTKTPFEVVLDVDAEKKLKEKKESKAKAKPKAKAKKDVGEIVVQPKVSTKPKAKKPVENKDGIIPTRPL